MDHEVLDPEAYSILFAISDGSDVYDEVGDRLPALLNEWHREASPQEKTPEPEILPPKDAAARLEAVYAARAEYIDRYRREDYSIEVMSGLAHSGGELIALLAQRGNPPIPAEKTPFPRG